MSAPPGNDTSASPGHVAAERLIVATVIGPGAEEGAALPAAPATVIKELLRQQRYAQALEMANALVQQKPDDPSAYNLQGAVYLGGRDLANAGKAFSRALSLQPGNVEAQLNLAQIDVVKKDYAKAQQRYRDILAKDAKNVDALLALAQIEANVNRNQAGGLDLLEKAKHADPEALSPRLFLATYYMRGRQFDKAFAELDAARRFHERDPEYLDLLGQVQAASGKSTDAVATFKILVAERPYSAQAHYRLGTALVGTEDYTAAAQSLQKALDLRPDYPEALDVLGLVELRAGHHSNALRLARQLEQLQPGSPAGFALEGDVQRAQNRYADAVKAYERAFAKRPTGLLAIKLHAARTAAGKGKEADAQLEQWLKQNPDDIGTWQYFAETNLKAGRNKVAIEQYRTVLAKYPDNVPALNNLAHLYQLEKDPGALDVAERAYKLMPDSPMTADTLGWILVERGDFTRGLPLIRQASEKDPSNALLRYHLAFALAKSGDKRRARIELESLLAGNAKFPQRDAAMRLLNEL
ncbi:MAG TPA: XrtA/PEP-CTERM system TPR-repeat protein PrsT [Burkholderiales bacterium]|nr:XrtA/PEP-CTERM system TPR-repeat protein PrsT [Burkholderiales bacterium]